LNHFAALIGIDWADRKHDLCLQVPGADAREYTVLPHSTAAIDTWATALQHP
jgi:hypothetical protein